jgi:hypothetical protein
MMSLNNQFDQPLLYLANIIAELFPYIRHWYFFQIVSLMVLMFITNIRIMKRLCGWAMYFHRWTMCVLKFSFCYLFSFMSEIIIDRLYEYAINLFFIDCLSNIILILCEYRLTQRKLLYACCDFLMLLQCSYYPKWISFLLIGGMHGCDAIRDLITLAKPNPNVSLIMYNFIKPTVIVITYVIYAACVERDQILIPSLVVGAHLVDAYFVIQSN